MSLKYVTRKLEDQSLEEEEAASLGMQAGVVGEEEGDDSGTESDDETETEPLEGDSEGCNLDSGVSLNLRSGSQTGRQSSRQLPSLVQETHKPFPPQQHPYLGRLKFDVIKNRLPQQLDLDDNHSSEEELEDIIGTNKVYSIGSPPGTLTGPSTSIKTCTSTNPEKRKWSEVNSSSSSDEAATHPHPHGRASACVLRAGSGSSGDEEVSGLLEGADGGTYTPVQFCTSPPLDVYKPRKSQSPPPKLFHMSMNGSSGIPRQNSLDSVRSREGPGRPSGAFRPRPRAARVGNSGLVEFSSLAGEGGEYQLREEVDRGERETASLEHEHGHRSPNKRHRSTPRPHNIQRPCLDFEKMQQIKTRVVTSWRQGTELSLFCW